MKMTSCRLVASMCLTVGLFAGSAMACPNCKNSAVEIVPTKDGPKMKSELENASAGGFNASIMLLLGGAGAVMGLTGWFVIRSGKSSTSDLQ